MITVVEDCAERMVTVMKWSKLFWKAIIYGLIGLLFCFTGSFKLGIFIMAMAGIMELLSTILFIKWLMGS